MSALHIETEGQGPELLLLHGWGLHGGVWDTLVPQLAPQFRVSRVDLPGHGRSREIPMPQSLAELAAQLLKVLPQRAVLLGWSLGGLVAQQIALHSPQRLTGLVLANTTPRFTAAADWPHGMPPEQLQEFASGLTQDYRETLQRFLSLQVRGDEAARAALRELRESLFAHGEPDTVSLSTGLALLRDSDLRAQARNIAVPSLVITGGYDRLTPRGAGEFLVKAIPGARHVDFPKSAHAPFLSHAGPFVEALRDFAAGLAGKSAA